MILAGLVLEPTPSPSPTAVEVSATLGSPGLLGFVVTFAVAVGVVLLARSMSRQLRRVAHRAPEAGDPGSGTPDPGAPDPGSPEPSAPADPPDSDPPDSDPPDADPGRAPGAPS